MHARRSFQTDWHAIYLALALPERHLCLLEFHQHAGAVLGVEEDDRLAVGARPRLVQAAHVLLLQGSHCLGDVVHLDTDVVHAARRVLVQEVLQQGGNRNGNILDITFS